MSYTKRDLAAFGEKLNNGGYPGIGGARRAIGKYDWSEKDKAAGHLLINKYFEEGAAKPAKAKAAGKSVKEKEAKPAKRRGRPPGKMSAATVASLASTPDFSQGYAPEIIPDDAEKPSRKREPVTEGIREPAFTAMYNAHSAIISALRAVSPLTPHEQELLDRAVAEAAVMCPTPEGKAYRAATWGGKQAVPSLQTARSPSPAVARPHIAIPPVAVEVKSAQEPPKVTEAAVDESPVILDPSQQERLSILKSSVNSIPDFGPKVKPLDVNGG
jgi:hypothetical protein